jgi:succinyl-diaminopimelate desuccinylase
MFQLYNRFIMQELLKELIQAESTDEKGELAAAKVLSAEFTRCGVSSQIDTWGNNRANVIARVKTSGRKPALLFACHLDVVGPGEASWKHPPFSAVESNGKIYGRGSADMKGGIAAVVTAIGKIAGSGKKLQGDIVFAAVAGEETNSCGAERFIVTQKELPEFHGIIIPEPTDFSIVTAHRGMLWLEVTTKGRAAHSSTPELGVNAITSMRHFLNELDNYNIATDSHKLLGRSSMSVNTISGGKTLNVVPDKCSIGIDIRTIPGQNNQDIIADLNKIFTRLKSENPRFEAVISVIRQVESLETDSDCVFVRDFCSSLGADETRAVGFTTDGPHFASLGAPVVIFGPGKPHLCHKPDEYIDIADIEKAVENYENLIVRFLG